MIRNLKELFKITHEENFEKFVIKLFKRKLGEEIIRSIQNCYILRDKPEINADRLNAMIIEETEVLNKILCNHDHNL